MQQRLVKTIRSTLVTRVDVYDCKAVLSSQEQAALESVAEKFCAELALRQAGITPGEIRRLEFVRWSLASRR